MGELVAVGRRSTTSSTNAVMLSLLPAASATSASVRAVSPATRVREQNLQAVVAEHAVPSLQISNRSCCRRPTAV